MPLTDTTPDAEAVQLELLRQMTPAQRLRLAMSASEFARSLAVARIQQESPELTVLEARWELLRRSYPSDPIPPKPPSQWIHKARTDERRNPQTGIKETAD